METDPYNYTPALNALSNSHLKHLKILGPPFRKGYADDTQKHLDYISCVLLMKDRIESISLTDEVFKETPLGSELHQFEQLTNIEILLRTDDGVDILERCDTAKKINFNFNCSPRMGNGFIQQSTKNLTAEISNYIPSIAVKLLSGILTDYDSFKLIVYIMHKFPQLDELDLNFALYKPVQLDLSVFADLLYYISKIDNVNIGRLLLNEMGISKTIGDVWNMTSPGPVSLDICYDPSENTTVMLNIFKRANGQSTRTKLTYNGPNFEWHALFELVLQSGRFLRNLGFKCFTYRFPSLIEVPENFIPHTLVHCPNIQSLRMEGCLLKRVCVTNLGRNYSLHELCFLGCSLYNGVPNQLSHILNDITRLELNFVKFLVNNGEEYNAAINIDMPNTNIKTLILRGYSGDDKAFVRVVSIDDNSCCYYRLDFVDYKYVIVESNEQEYNALNDDMHIYICCRSNPTIEV